MMLTNKKSTNKSWLKTLALLPIVAVALALNAETVNDYVYENTPAQPQKKVVKKGRKDAKVKMGTETIEVKAEEPQDKAEAAPTPNPIEDVKIIMGEAGDKEPLLVIDGKVATREQLQALDQKEIDHVNVVKYSEKTKDLLKVYANSFNADTSNGIIFINTKEFVKNGKKDVVVVVKKSEKEETEPSGVFDVVEEMPQFPGGPSELFKFLAETVKYPEAAEKAGTQGRVIVSFIVEKDGSISSGKVQKSVSEELDAEALRVVNAMPKWTPGKQSGKAVRVKYTIPITFRLQ